MFDIYVLGVSTRLINVDETASHWKGICHISGLTLVAFSLRTVSLLLPTTHEQVNALQLKDRNAFEWIALAFISLSLLIAINIPRGPPLHFRAEQIYSPKMLETFYSEDPSLDNVCAVVQSSVFSFLLFSYTTVVANLGHTSESLEVRDLPIVPASYRASNHFANMRKATLEDEEKKAAEAEERRFSGHKRKTKRFWQKEGSGFPLLMRLFRINKRNISVQIILATVTAVSYYFPAWFVHSEVLFER